MKTHLAAPQAGTVGMSTQFLPRSLAGKIILLDSNAGLLPLLLALHACGRTIQNLLCLALRDSGGMGSTRIEILEIELYDTLLSLYRAGASRVILSCNTAHALVLRKSWGNAFHGMAIDGPINVVCHALAEASWRPATGRILILGSEVLNASGIYQDKIEAMSLPCRIMHDFKGINSLANGVTSGVAEHLAQLIAQERAQGPICAVVLACTHYSAVALSLQTLITEKVIDSGTVFADALTEGCLKPYLVTGAPPPMIVYVARGEPERLGTVFRQLAPELTFHIQEARDVMHIPPRDFPLLTKDGFLRLLGDSSTLIEWLSHPEGRARLSEFLPWLPELWELEQNVPHHIENAGPHSASLIRIDPVNDVRLNLIKLAHDAGKLETWKAERRFRGHEAVSAELLRPLAESLGFSATDVAEMCWAVAEHMNSHAVLALPISEILRIRKHPAFSLWLRLCYADERSRGGLWRESHWIDKMERIERILDTHSKTLVLRKMRKRQRKLSRFISCQSKTRNPCAQKLRLYR